MKEDNLLKIRSIQVFRCISTTSAVVAALKTCVLSAPGLKSPRNIGLSYLGVYISMLLLDDKIWLINEPLFGLWELLINHFFDAKMILCKKKKLSRRLIKVLLIKFLEANPP